MPASQARLAATRPADDRTSCSVCGQASTAPLGEKRGYRFRECIGCGFVFIANLDQATLERRYAEGHCRPEQGGAKTGWAKTPEFLEPAFAALGGAAGHDILDFGCGHSRLAQQVRDCGNRVLGVDLEAPGQPHPDRLTGDILSLDIEPARFDLVYSFQVFEHLPEPVPIFRRLLELTRPGGYLLIHTDMETPERDQQGFFDWFYVLPPDHCAYYRHRTFRTMLDGSDGKLVWSDPKSVLIQRA